MRRYIYIALLVLFSVCAHAHTELSPETNHFVAFNGDLGLSTLLHNIPDYPTSAGLNTNLGVAYRLYHNNLLFSAGVEAAYQLNTNDMSNLDFRLPMMDTESDLFGMHVMITKSRDRSHMLNLNIPLLIGGEWGRFYFLAGPKISVNLYGAASSDALYTTYGEYDRYYDDFYDMPNHQFETNRNMSSGTLPMKWGFNVMAHLELGGRLGNAFADKSFEVPSQKVRMYLAAYVDFGVLNIHSSQGGAPVFDYRETSDKGLQFYIQPLMLSTVADNAVVRNMNIGIKYTVCLQVHEDPKAYIYDWYNLNQNARINRGGTQVIKNNKREK